MEYNNLILIVDDDIDFANFIYDVANTLNFSCKVTTNSHDFMNSYDSSVKLIFMDLNIPDMDGIELLRFIETKKYDTDIILMSGVDKRIIDSAKEFAISKGLSVVNSFQKPIRLVELEDMLKKFTRPKSPKIENKSEAKQVAFTVTENEIIQAIRQDNFIVFYQPKVEIPTEKFIGVEAVIRWQHPLYGLILPDQFVPLAESSGLIEEITRLNITRAIKEISAIKRQIDFDFMLSLNLSPFSLHDLTFPDKFMNLINQFSIKPENIIFEITETGLLKEISSVLDIFTRLRLKKIQLSIDDFGTGYAMMQHLKLIPATEIKIDKSFIQNMFELDSAQVTVKKIIEIGHELGMKVTAEGVETVEQLQSLKELQCDIAQGYYYSKPIPISELVDWINHHNHVT